MSARYGVVWGSLTKPIPCACQAEGGFYNALNEDDFTRRDYGGLVWDNKADAQAYCDDRTRDTVVAGDVADYRVVTL